MDSEQTFDFCVCGNGMVGGAAVIALAQQGYRVVWLAPEQLQPFSPDDQPDIRVSAISLGNAKFLEQINVWPSIVSMRAREYHTLRVWEVDGVETHFSAQDIQQTKLGYFIENRLIQLACLEAVGQYSNITMLSESLHRVEYDKQGNIYAVLSNEQTLKSQFIIGAEGAQSKVRKSAGIETIGWQYEQQALGIIVELDQPAQGETWQKFFPSGPRALLPMHDNYAALIWYDAPEKLNALKRLGDQELHAQIVAAFPQCLPKINHLLSRAQFPLARMHAKTYMKRRVILVGDAAHTVNPLAGQGVNMGFNDIRALIEALSKLPNGNIADKCAQTNITRDYGIKQYQKNTVMMTALDTIYQGFKREGGPAQWLRNAGLFLAQRSGPLKSLVIKFAAGLE